MSMIYCHEHDRLVDTDWHEDCPECLQEAAEAAEGTELTTVELIASKDIRGAEPTLWTLAARSISEESRKHWTIPERDHGVWYVVYQSTDFMGPAKDAMELAKGSHHYEYAVGCPTKSEDV